MAAAAAEGKRVREGNSTRRVTCACRAARRTLARTLAHTHTPAARTHARTHALTHSRTHSRTHASHHTAPYLHEHNDVLNVIQRPRGGRFGRRGAGAQHHDEASCRSGGARSTRHLAGVPGQRRCVVRSRRWKRQAKQKERLRLLDCAVRVVVVVVRKNRATSR